jgi:HEAT repeat protein
MKRRVLIAFAILLLLVLWAITWGLARHVPSVHGKPETLMIKSLANAAGPGAYGQEQSLGPEAVPVLLQALKSQPGTFARAYSNTWSELPASLQSNLPAPVDDANIRIRASALLVQQKSGAGIPLSALARALNDSEWAVRVNALVCLCKFILPESRPDKADIFPLLVTATEDSRMEVRMSAVNCLGFYKDQPDRVIPYLTNALADYSPDVRIPAAMALDRVDPIVAEEAGAVAVAFDCLESNGPMGSRQLAADFLQKLGKLPPKESK